MPMRAPKHEPFSPGKRVRKEVHSRRTGHYDQAWKDTREAFLLENPYCMCDECKKDGRLLLAEVVDHIETIEDRPDLRLDWNNLRSMTKRHHDRHTMREMIRKGQMKRYD